MTDCAQRFLLRSVLSRGVLSCYVAKELLSTEFPDADEFNVQDLVEQINQKIKPFQQKIKIVDDETTLQKTLVFLSLGYDDATKSQNMFTEAQLDYFRNILEQILTIESRQITEMNALNLRNTISQRDAEALLITWCRMYYLEKNSTNYVLGVRAIHEFERYIEENLPDTIRICSLCEKNVFRGYNCPACQKAVHTNCLKEYEKHKKWLCCSADFNRAYLDRLDDPGMSQTLRSTLPPVDHSHSTIDTSEYNDNGENDEPIPGPSTAGRRRRRIMS